MSNRTHRHLSKKLKLFADIYRGDGDLRSAAIRAGLHPNYVYLSLNENEKLRDYLQETRKLTVDADVEHLIAERQDLHIWTEVMRDPLADMKDRIKCSENLAKSRGEFNKDNTEGGSPVVVETRMHLTIAERVAEYKKTQSEE